MSRASLLGVTFELVMRPSKRGSFHTRRTIDRVELTHRRNARLAERDLADLRSGRLCGVCGLLGCDRSVAGPGRFACRGAPPGEQYGGELAPAPTALGALAPKADRRAAIAGEEFKARSGTVLARMYAGGETIAEKTEGDDPTRGQWLCIRCGVPLANPMEKESHCSERVGRVNCLVRALGPDSVHVLAWRSFASGKLECP